MTAMDLERRRYEHRAVVAGTKSHPIIRGTAIVFNERSQDLGGFVEVIKPEAFERTVAENIDLRAFFDHDPAKVLGRQSAGTLKVDADRRGVNIEIDPPSVTDPPNLMESIARGDISGFSFSFRIMPNGDEWKREGERIVRTVTDMRVFEVSIVSMPAYAQTDVEVALRALRGFEERLPRTILQLRQQAEARAASWR
jgi:Escherichia/Staphylococcus phage prohead protease